MVENPSKTVELVLIPAAVAGETGRARILRTVAAAGLCTEQGAELCLIWPEDAFLTGAACLQALLDSLDPGSDALTPVFRGEKGWPVLVRRETFAAMGDLPGAACVAPALRRAGCRQSFLRAEDPLCAVLAKNQEDLELMEICGRVPYRGVPDAAVCRALLAEVGTLPHIVRHCEKTAQVAVELAESLRAGGYELDIDLVRAGALLHDVLRLTPPHALTGAKLLAERGWFETAEVVRQHMDLPEGQEDKINESAVVFFADKLAMEDRRVSLRRRHENSCTKADSEAMRAYIWRRFQVARITERALCAALELDRDVL